MFSGLSPRNLSTDNAGYWPNAVLPAHNPIPNSHAKEGDGLRLWRLARAPRSFTWGKIPIRRPVTSYGINPIEAVWALGITSRLVSVPETNQVLLSQPCTAVIPSAKRWKNLSDPPGCRSLTFDSGVCPHLPFCTEHCEIKYAERCV